MREAVIVSSARTPIGKAYRGLFNDTNGPSLGAIAIRAAVERAKVDPAEIDDVIMGCATPEGATGANIARQIALRAGLPITTSGMTVNRFCSSGLQTIAMAAQRIIAGEGEVFAAGGVESMSRVPIGSDGGAWAQDPATNFATGFVPQGIGADLIATLGGWSREDVDRFALTSQQRAAAAQAAGLLCAGLTSHHIPRDIH